MFANTSYISDLYLTRIYITIDYGKMCPASGAKNNLLHPKPFRNKTIRKMYPEENKVWDISQNITMTIRITYARYLENVTYCLSFYHLYCPITGPFTKNKSWSCNWHFINNYICAHNSLHNQTSSDLQKISSKFLYE